MVSCGDFNVIRNRKEKLRGLPIIDAEVKDFNHCINICLLEDMRYKGSKYTWWDGRTDKDCIFKRLDMVFCKDKILTSYLVIEVEYEIKSGSDHAFF